MPVRRPTPVKLVPLRRAIRLVGLKPTREDFRDWDPKTRTCCNPCTPKQRKVLVQSFRVDVPAEMPLLLACRLIGALAERLSDDRDLAVLWQLNALVYDFKRPVEEARELTFDQAIEAINEGKVARGMKPYKPKGGRS